MQNYVRYWIYGSMRLLWQQHLGPVMLHPQLNICITLLTVWHQLTWLLVQRVLEHIDEGESCLLQLCLQFPVLPLRSLPTLPTVYTVQAAFRSISTAQTCLQQRKTEISEFQPEKHMHTDHSGTSTLVSSGQTRSCLHFYALMSCYARLLMHWRMHLCQLD